MGIKKHTLKRLLDISNRVEEKIQKYPTLILKSMRTEELRELADDNITEKRANEIWERAKYEYKQKFIKKNQSC